MTMNKILLKMTDVHAGFAAIRRTFEAIDVDGSGEIDTLEFEAAVTCLQIKVPNGMDASSLFHASDLTQDGKLGFKEFLIASMLCHLLAADASSSQVCMAENLPVKEQSSPVPSPGSTHHSSPMPSPGGTPGTPKRSTVVPHGDEDERRAADAAAAAVAKKAFLASKKHFSASAFAKAATVVADAWIVCDLDMDGFITKSELRQALGGGATPQDAAKGQSSKNGADVDGLALLRTRFDEMDFDRSGLISCQEFFYAFNSWLDDPDEEDE